MDQPILNSSSGLNYDVLRSIHRRQEITKSFYEENKDLFSIEPRRPLGVLPRNYRPTEQERDALRRLGKETIFFKAIPSGLFCGIVAFRFMSVQTPFRLIKAIGCGLVGFNVGMTLGGYGNVDSVLRELPLNSTLAAVMRERKSNVRETLAENEYNIRDNEPGEPKGLTYDRLRELNRRTYLNKEHSRTFKRNVHRVQETTSRTTEVPSVRRSYNEYGDEIFEDF